MLTEVDKRKTEDYVILTFMVDLFFHENGTSTLLCILYMDVVQIVKMCIIIHKQ